VTLNWSKDPKKDADPDKFQVQSIVVPMAGDKKPPKPEDDSYSEFTRRIWKTATAKNIMKDRIKITFKKQDGMVKDNGSNIVTTNGLKDSDRLLKNLSSRGESTRKREAETPNPRIEKSPNRMDPRLSRSLDRSRGPAENTRGTTTTTTTERGRDGSRPPENGRPDAQRTATTERGRDTSRTPLDASRDNSRVRMESSSRTPDRLRESTDRSSRVSTERLRESADRFSERDRNYSRSRESSIDPQYRRSATRRDYDDIRYRSISRSRDREDRGRSGYVSDRSRTRESSIDSGYRSLDVSRSPTRSRSRGGPDVDRRSDMSRKSQSQLDLIREYKELQNNQKALERQKLFIVVAFFVGIFFSKWFLT
jgi:hypothetical protein